MEQLVGTVPGKIMLAVLFSAWPSALGIKTCWCGVGGGDDAGNCGCCCCGDIGDKVRPTAAVFGAMVLAVEALLTKRCWWECCEQSQCI